MAFDSDHASENKVSSGAGIWSPQNEKLKGMCLKTMSLELSCIAHLMRKKI